MPHELPQLPYDHDALEPTIDGQTMRIHHGKHHQAYVNNLNAALEKHPELQSKSVEDLIRGLRWSMELAHVGDRFVVLPVSFDRLALAKVQRAVAYGGEQVRAYRAVYVPALTARPQVGEQILNELLGQRILADVARGEVAERRVVGSKHRFECALVSGAHACDERVRAIR